MKILQGNGFEKAEILYELEERLNQHKFLDIQIGSTLADIYYLNFFQNKNWGISSIIKEILLFIRYFYFPPKPRLNNIINNNKYSYKEMLITSISDRNELINLIKPIINSLNTSEYKIIGNNWKLINSFEKDIDFVSWEDINLGFTNYWKTEYQRSYGNWHKTIRKFLREKRIPYIAFWKLALNLLIQSNRIYISKEFIRKLSPKIIMTEFDRNYFSSSLILAAKYFKIPSVTLEHGVLNPPYSGYLPVIADYFFCWGQEQNDILIHSNQNTGKIFITGNPRFIENNNNNIDYKNNQRKNRLTIVLGTSPINTKERQIFVNEFCKAIRNLSQKIDIYGIIRLHPSEKLDFYKDSIKTYPEIHFSPNNEFTKEEIFGSTQIVIVRDSGFGNDAILANLIVIIFNPFSNELGNGKFLIKNAGCPYTYDHKSLENEILKISSNSEYKQSLVNKLSEYKTYFCHGYGQNAADNIVDEVHYIIKKNFKDLSEVVHL